MAHSFSSTQEVIPFDRRNKDGVVTELFVLVELDGTRRDRYLKEMQKRIEVNQRTGKALKVKDLDGMQALILVYSARKVASVKGMSPEDGSHLPTAEDLSNAMDQGSVSFEDLELVTLTSQEIQAWGSKMQTTMADEALKLSGLAKDARDEEKKD